MSPEILSALIAAALVASISLSGILFTSARLGALIRKNLSYLATFSGGVFLVVTYHLLEESIHESGSLPLVVGSLLFGVALMQALHHLLPDEHHHHGTEHGHDHSGIDGRRVLLSDALHNIGDGVLLIAAFTVDWVIGLVATVGIIVHEFVQEISEYFVLREAGYAHRDALLRNALSSLSIFVGVALAAFIASAHEIAILFAGVAAGGFLVIIIQDLIPHALRSARREGSLKKHAVAALLGMTLMLTLQLLTPHTDIDKAPQEGLASASIEAVNYC